MRRLHSGVSPLCRLRQAGPAGNARRRPDTGSVTVEIALTLPVLVVVMLAAIWGVMVAAAQVACVDAARAGARAAARGERLPAVQAAVRAAAPPGAHVTVRRTSGLAIVEVRFTARPGPAAGLPGPVLSERVVALTEPGVEEDHWESETSARPAAPDEPARPGFAGLGEGTPPPVAPVPGSPRPGAGPEARP